MNILKSGLCLAVLVCTLCSTNPNAFGQQKNILIKTLEEEQKRDFEILKKKGDPPPYFLSYYVTDSSTTNISASFGALRGNTFNRSRNLDVSIRVGNYKLDNTAGRGGTSNSQKLPVDDDSDAIKAAIWQTTDGAYKNAVDTLLQIKTQKETSVEDEYPADNFSPTQPQAASLPQAQLSVDRAEWEKRIKTLSAVFKKYPEILSSFVSFSADVTNKYFVSSEGASLQHGKTLVRISMSASIKAADGMDLFRFDAFDAVTPDGLPNDARLTQAAEKIVKDLIALKNAPVVEPFAGPAILSGRASGVFFHEIFGHRIEGHRQKDNFEGNTFTAKVKQSVLPAFLSVIDDPTLPKLGSTDLNGYYQFDDEGVRAQKVPLVQNGILHNFLMSRSPIIGFPTSNGHGRASPGFAPVSRQGNLIVQSSKSVTKAQLRQMLIAEIKKQGKKFGLFFEDISGGFTNTSRFSTQAFQVMPIMVYRVYPDGRPDELVRGVDLIGTPLTSFSKIIAADDKPEVFNGFCGAESGFIPVSAISPSILISQIEIQKRAKGNDLAPILPPPNQQ